jgi:hypothetical protein
LEAVHFGKHDVEDDGVVFVGSCKPEALLAVAGEIDGVAALPEGRSQASPESRGILNDQ